MKIGLIGMQNSGKSTVFNALTGMNVEVSAYSSEVSETHIAVVNVHDERIERLSAIYKPKKTSFATFELHDFPGFSPSGNSANGKSRQSLEDIHYMDALGIVLRNFSDELQGDPDPQEELGLVDVELLVPDMALAEKRLERLEGAKKRGQAIPNLDRELELMRRIMDHLSDDKPLRSMEMSEDDLKLIRGYNFLTLKPLLLILNSDESTFRQDSQILEKLNTYAKSIEFCGKFEMDLASLDDPEEANLFMEDMNITSSARDRLAVAAYATLGLISFFTVGDDEVKAWTIKDGETALDAARVIHTDLARGFIRAQCFTYDNLIAVGSEKKLREAGLFSLQGKEYRITDGTILTIMFNV